MHLKSYLRNSLKEIIQGYEEEIDRVESGLQALSRVRMGNARYVVKLNPTNDPHEERSVEIEHKGTIGDAVKKAENTYKRDNSTGNIGDNVKYEVQIVLGRDTYPIPEEYWTQYVQNSRKS